MWLKVDAGFLRHPKTCDAAARLGGPRKRALGRIAHVWLEIALYSTEYLTDGFIPAAMLDDLRTEPSGREVVDALVAAGMAHDAAGGLRLHDWADYQPSAAAFKAKRKRDRDRKRATRHSGDPSAPPPDGPIADVRADTAAPSARIPPRSRARDPVPSPEDQDPKEPRGGRRALRAELSLDEGRTHLLAAVHRLIESGAPYVDAAGVPNDAELLAELKTIAARDLGIAWEHAAELGRLVDSVVGTRKARAAR
jgi:hypothetical protein